MANNNYDSLALADAITDVSILKNDISEINKEIDTFILGLDARVKMHFFKDFTFPLRNSQSELTADSKKCDTFNTWLTTTVEELNATIAATEDIANSAIEDENNIDSSIDTAASSQEDASLGEIAGIAAGLAGITSGEGDADKVEEYTLEPEAWNNLPADIQGVIKAKLEELGFTDDEIKNITEGKVAVDKVSLEKLSKELENAIKNNPDLRVKLLELYGFDIFNEDGTVNKDLLAIAMLMDNKKPNDQYNLQVLLKQLSLEGVDSSINSRFNLVDVEKADIQNVGTDQSINDITRNNAIGVENINMSHAMGTSSYNVMKELDNNLLNSDISGKDIITTNNMATGLSSLTVDSGGVLPEGASDLKKGSLGAIPIVAGIGAAVAAGGAMMKKSKDADKEKENNNDEEHDFDDFFEQQMENNRTIDSHSDDDNKDWLYGLGIGLGAVAGAGAAKYAKDHSKIDDENE